MNRKELTRRSEDIADDFRRLADNLRALRDKEAKAANLGRQRQRLTAQAGELFTQAAEYLPGAQAIVELFCGPKSGKWDARTWEAVYRNLWRFVVSWPASRHPGSMMARPGEDNFPRIKTDADGKPLGRDGKPLTVVEVKDRTGTEWKLSGPVGTEVDDYDAEDHGARFRRLLTDDADACQILAAELRTSLSRKDSRPDSARAPAAPSVAKGLNAPKATRTSLREVQRRLLGMCEQGIRFSSMADLAVECQCSPPTVHKAIHGSPKLEAWMEKFKPPVIEARSPVRRNPTPEEELQAKEEADAVLRFLIEEAPEKDRGWLNHVADTNRPFFEARLRGISLERLKVGPPENQNELVKRTIAFLKDSYTEDASPGGNRIPHSSG